MSEGKVRVIIKRPEEEFGHVTNISTSLKNLQNTVGGHVESVAIAVFGDGNEIVILCDEEGRLKGKEFNCEVCGIDFVGDIICAQLAPNEEGEMDFVDLEISFGVWKEIVLGRSDL